MSAMIGPVSVGDLRGHQIERHPFEAERGGLDLVTNPGKVAIFEASNGEQLWSASGQHSVLQSEVATLRRELYEAERMISLLEQLLRNTQVRERELRKELLDHQF